MLPVNGAEQPRREAPRTRRISVVLWTLRSGVLFLGSLYEQRDMRWIEEKHRLDEDKEKVQLLLRQVFGVGVVGELVEDSAIYTVTMFFSLLPVGGYGVFFRMTSTNVLLLTSTFCSSTVRPILRGSFYVCPISFT
jgi:hypothetical protein